jgi:hypothetical protein
MPSVERAATRPDADSMKDGASMPSGMTGNWISLKRVAPVFSCHHARNSVCMLSTNCLAACDVQISASQAWKGGNSKSATQPAASFDDRLCVTPTTLNAAGASALRAAASSRGGGAG